jgi:hypothetical protein
MDSEGYYSNVSSVSIFSEINSEYEHEIDINCDYDISDTYDTNSIYTEPYYNYNTSMSITQEHDDLYSIIDLYMQQYIEPIKKEWDNDNDYHKTLPKQISSLSRFSAVPRNSHLSRFSAVPRNSHLSRFSAVPRNSHLSEFSNKSEKSSKSWKSFFSKFSKKSKKNEIKFYDNLIIKRNHHVSTKR